MGKGKARNLPGMLAHDWVGLFQKSGVLREVIAQSRSQRLQATLIGKFFAIHLNREVPIVVHGRPARAKLRSVDAGQRQKKYYFEIAMDGEGPCDDSPTARSTEKPADPGTAATARAERPPKKKRQGKKRTLDR